MKMVFKPVVFIADDDLEDRRFLRKAWKRINPSCDCAFFKNGQKLMDHLVRLNRQTGGKLADFPCLIAVNWNMPRKNGAEVIQELKQDANLCDIPVVMILTLSDPDLKQYCLKLGAADCLLKPSNVKAYDTMMEKLASLCKKWCEKLDSNCEDLGL